MLTGIFLNEFFNTVLPQAVLPQTIFPKNKVSKKNFVSKMQKNVLNLKMWGKTQTQLSKKKYNIIWVLHTNENHLLGLPKR